MELKYSVEDVLKGLEQCTTTCKDCYFAICGEQCSTVLHIACINVIKKLQAENDKLQKLQHPTETSGFKIEKGKVIFYTNILNGYRYEYNSLEEIVKDLNLALRQAYKNDEIISYYKGKIDKIDL